uniref:Putative secreted peptide n=1 Tax=Anopheles braziliensis TaxID=58242 RepID=A0A2M3ZWE0_9DIPT
MQPCDRQLQSPVVLLVTLPVVAHVGEGAACNLLSQIEPTIVLGRQIEVRSTTGACHFGVSEESFRS